MLVAGILIFAAGMGYLLVTERLLSKISHRVEQMKDLADEKNPGARPGVSILVPIKGPAKGLPGTLKCLLNQRYSGPIEIILAFQDPLDTDIHVAESIVDNHPKENIKIQILKGLEFLGHNPKNSNLTHATRMASYDWFYFCDVDTEISPRFIDLAISDTQFHKDRVVTGISVHVSSSDFGSHLESMGSNLEMAGYFSLVQILKNKSAINGASFMMHRDLLRKLGGFEITLNTLTDDLVLARALEKINVKSSLVPDFAYVHLQNETFAGFWKRFSRWILIVKYFDPPMFWMAPLSWYWQWLLLLGALDRNAVLLSLSLGMVVARVLVALRFQILLKTQKPEWYKCIYLPFFDFFAPFIWFSAIFTASVTWGGRRLVIGKGGQLKRADEQGGSVTRAR